VRNLINIVALNCTVLCGVVQYFEMFVRPWLAFTLVSAIPFIVIAVSNSLIIRALVVRRRQMTASSRPSSSHEKHFVQVAVMCVAASGLFLVCSLPSIILLIGKPFWDVPKGENPAYQVRSYGLYVCFLHTLA